MSHESTASRWSQRWLLLGIVGWLVLLGLATSRHVFWADETAPWMMAIENGFRGLWSPIQYEGHPPLWFYIVKVVTLYTANPEWMKLPNLLATLLAGAVVLSIRNLRVPVRLALVVSYFLLFEYGLVCRNYMIGVAFLLLAARLCRRAERDLPIFAALALAALSSAGALLVSVLLAVYILALRRGLAWTARRVAGVTLFSLSAALSAAVIYPPVDSGSILLRDHSSLGHRLADALASIAAAYLPVPGHPVAFWNITLLSRGPWWLEPATGLLLVGALLRFFPRGRERIFFLAASAALLLLDMYTGRLFMRHVGWLFVVWLLALMLTSLSAAPTNPAWTRGRMALLSFLLVVQAGSGLYATAVSLFYPFAPTLAVANLLRTQHLADGPMIVAPGVVASPILAYLHRKQGAFFAEYHGPGSYVAWTRTYVGAPHMPTPAEVDAQADSGKPIAFLSLHPLTPTQCQQFQVRLLASFDRGTIETDFPYFVYVREPKDVQDAPKDRTPSLQTAGNQAAGKH